MTISLSGTAGNTFNITKTDTATNVGNSVITYTTESTVSSVTYTDSSKVAAMSGTVGTAGTTITLSALVNVTVSSDTLAVQDASAPIAFTSLRSFQVVNKSLNTITIVPAASNSYFPASTLITIPAATATNFTSVQFAYGNAQTITASNNDQIKIVGSSNSSAIEVYILG